MPIAGSEVIRGFVPTANYTVLFKKVEPKKSSKGLPMVEVEVEILGPEIAEYAGRQYNVLGVTGRMFVMLDNKNGVDAALSALSPTLNKLGFDAVVPKGTEYGETEVKDFLVSLQGGRFNMLVSSRTRYVTAEQGPDAAFDPAKAVRDPETNEPEVAGYSYQFDFRLVKGRVASPDQF